MSRIHLDIDWSISRNWVNKEGSPIFSNRVWVLEDLDILPFEGRVKWCLMHRVLFWCLSAMPGLTPFGFLPSIMLKALFQGGSWNALYMGAKGDIERHSTRRCHHILDNGGACHLGFQGDWRPRRWYRVIPCHRRFPQGVRSILTGVACECLRVLGHFLLGVCNTCRFKQCDGRWDSCDRGMRGTTYHCASHNGRTSGCRHKGCNVVCLLEMFSNRWRD